MVRLGALGARSDRRANHSAPGVSVKPWAMIEQNTATAARLKILEPAATRSPSTSSANVMVEMPLGPNQDMKVRVAVSVAVPVSATNTATGRATKSVTTTIATAAQP